MSRQQLADAAKQWRDSVSDRDLPEVRGLAERTAANLERQAETGIATCVCCGKTYGRGTLQN